MTSKQIIAKIWDTPGAVESVKRNYAKMLYALLEIGLDWEGEIESYPKKSRCLLTIAKDLEWLSGILKQVTGMTWEELTYDK